MKFKAQILAATIAASFMFAGGAEACSLAAWTGTAVGSPEVGLSRPDDVKRYSGKCGMKPSADNIASYVTDNNPASENIYRARMYVFTGDPSGTVKFFSATDADDHGGTEVISVDFDGSAFNFNVGGSTGQASSIEKNKWYSIELVHSVGKPFTAKVGGAAKVTAARKDEITTVSGSGNSAGSIQSASFGVITPAAGSGSMSFDQFDSTRNETTEIGRLCRGNVSTEASPILTVTDLTLIVNELLPGTAVVENGQPDFSEDGRITVTDLTTMVPFILPPNNGACPNS